MAYAQVQICNIAIGMVGGRRIIDINQQDSTEAMLLKEMWDLCVEDTLAGRDWSFARTIIPVSAVIDPLSLDRKCYQVPPDALTVRRLGTDPTCKNDMFWEIQNGVIVVESEVAYVRYTHKIYDLSKFDAPFVSALCARLAYELALPVANNRSLWEAMLTLAASRLDEGAAINGIQGKRESFTPGLLSKARNR